MLRSFLFLSLTLLTSGGYSQDTSFVKFLNDPAMIHASVSFCLVNADNGLVEKEYNSARSLVPASVLKLITSAAALELLGPEYTFKTVIGYAGSLNRKSGKLTGDIIIKGGGDPTLGSVNFPDYNPDFVTGWVTEIKKLGIKKIDGCVRTDDSYFDYLPVPSKWLWEDAGNYFGAGTYGLSVFDNTYEIHFKTGSDSSAPVITGIIPSDYTFDFKNFLLASGDSDKGNVYAAPYSSNGWLAGTLPVNQDDFVLEASIADPPLFLARMFTNKLMSEGIYVSQDPTTTRLDTNHYQSFVPIAESVSPPLSEIVKVLNHESVNLYAEHLLKELGKKYRNNGSTASGIEVIKDFLVNTGVGTEGIFIEDGSGMSPANSINSRELVRLLTYMRNSGKYFSDYYSSLPSAGKEGTLKNYFTDPVFDARLKAKSGSMTRVRCYAGYFTTVSGANMVFSILVNNFSGPPRNIVSGIESVLKEIILNN